MEPIGNNQINQVFLSHYLTSSILSRDFRAIIPDKWK